MAWKITAVQLPASPKASTEAVALESLLLQSTYNHEQLSGQGVIRDPVPASRQMGPQLSLRGPGWWAR